MHPAFPLRYLSVWAILLIALAPYTHRHINLLLLASIVLASAFTIFYVHPRRLKLRPELPDVTRPGQLLAIDLIFHWLPFLFVLTFYAPFYRANPWGPHTAATCFILALYLLFGDFPSTYDADPHLALLAFFMGVLLYTMLLHIY